MAIGSDPEIGAVFSTLNAAWDWTAWRKAVGDDLMGGYGKLCVPDPDKILDIQRRWDYGV